MSAENGTVSETIDSTAVEIPTVPQVGALIPTGGTTLAVAPQVQPEELVQRLQAITEAQKKAMVSGTDYGVIPGTKKPTLLKPGAEKLAVLFQLDVQMVNEKIWGADDDHLTVISRAVAFHAPTGARLGFGEGVCSTREKKYAKRIAARTCPQCAAETIFRSRNEGEGWYCWKKKGGCGAQFAAGAPEIIGQEEGEKPNPDIPDAWNTVVKMAEKRARVNVVLAVTGASAIFTQDVEDGAPGPDQEPTGQVRRQRGPQLDEETFSVLRGGVAALRLSYGDINHILGAFGANGAQAETPGAVDIALRALSKDQATKVGAHLEKLAQDRAAEAPQEGGGADGRS